MKTAFLVTSITLLVSLTLVGCGISQTDYDAVMAERDGAIAAKESAEAQVKSLQSELSKSESQNSSLESELATTKLMIDVLQTVIDNETQQQQPSTPTTTVSKDFSKYGFGFNYPENFNITEMGMLSTEANNESGIIQATSGSGMDIFQVGWFNVTPSFYELMGDSQQLLDDSFSGLNMPGIGSINRGNILETTIAGHPMVYQGFTAEILVVSRMWWKKESVYPTL